MLPTRSKLQRDTFKKLADSQIAMAMTGNYAPARNIIAVRARDTDARLRNLAALSVEQIANP